jgi:hypothetical protein
MTNVQINQIADNKDFIAQCAKFKGMRNHRHRLEWQTKAHSSESSLEWQRLTDSNSKLTGTPSGVPLSFHKPWKTQTNGMMR